MANILNGVEIIRAWTDVLNDICKTDGGIDRDDSARIWDPWLHRLTTQEWEDIWAALEALQRDQIGAFTNSDLEILWTTRQVLDSKDARTRDRVMDTKAYKKYAWRQMCSMREVVNRYNDINIPNRLRSPEEPSSPKPKTSRTSDRPTPLFNELFQ